MTFGQKWQKIKMAAILAWFGRNDSKLKLKLFYKRALDNSYFSQYMYFAIAAIRLTISKFPEKNSKFEMLYLGKYLSHKSAFYGDYKT